MTDFRILARIQHTAPNEFLAMAAAMPTAEFPPELVGKGVKWGPPAPSKEEASAQLEGLIREISGWVRARDDKVLGTDFEFQPLRLPEPEPAPEMKDLINAVNAALRLAERSEKAAQLSMIAAGACFLAVFFIVAAFVGR